MGTNRWKGTPLGRGVDEGARERRIAIWLFAATAVSVFGVHWVSWQAAGTWSETLLGSAAFAISLLGILLAHEAGHWLYSRSAGFRLSLPWFLPAPFWVGTLGAVIKVRERPPNRSALLGMGVSGPLAGLVVVIGVLLLRAMLPAMGSPDPEWTLRRPLLWWLVGVPFGRVDVPTPSDPLGFAAWVGCLVTAMNLLPFGQLDGGHVFGAWWPEARTGAMWLTTVALLLMGLVWPPWALWAGLLHAMRASKSLEARDEREALTTRAKWLGLAGGAAWLLCVTPAPTSW